MSKLFQVYGIGQGLIPVLPPPLAFETPPNSNQTNYEIGQLVYSPPKSPTGFWLYGGNGAWIEIATSSGDVLSLTGNSGGPVFPSISGTINVLTANASVTFQGTANTLTANFLDLASGNLLLGSAVAQTLNPASANNLTSVGSGALNSVTSATYSTAVGVGSLQSLTTGASNTAVGAASLSSCVTGTLNTAVGYFALVSALGSRNIAIGQTAGLSYVGSESSNIVIGNTGTASESHVLRIGTNGSGNSQQSSCYVAGITGVTVAGSAPIAVNSSSQISSLGFGSAGQVLTSNGPNNSPTWQSGAITSVNHSASPYAVLAADEFLACQTSTGTITIQLPNAPTTGRVITIKDSNGAAAASNISVTTVGGTVTIDGVTTYTISTNYQSIQVIFDGTNYEVF